MSHTWGRKKCHSYAINLTKEVGTNINKLKIKTYFRYLLNKKKKNVLKNLFQTELSIRACQVWPKISHLCVGNWMSENVISTQICYQNCSPKIQLWNSSPSIGVSFVHLGKLLLYWASWLLATLVDQATHMHQQELKYSRIPILEFELKSFRFDPHEPVQVHWFCKRLLWHLTPPLMVRELLIAALRIQPQLLYFSVTGSRPGDGENTLVKYTRGHRYDYLIFVKYR